MKFNVLDLQCGTHPVLKTIARMHPDDEIFYIGVDSSLPSKIGRKLALDALLPPRMNASFEQEKLDYANVKAFSRQLKRILRGKLFDEIHCHNSAFVGNDSSACLKALKTLSACLKPGGRFIHIINSSSPFVDVPSLSRLSSTENARATYETNLALLKEHAGKAGFEVEQYVIPTSDAKTFFASVNPSKERIKLDSSMYSKFVRDLTLWPKIVSHVMIFKKA